LDTTIARTMRISVVPSCFPGHAWRPMCCHAMLANARRPRESCLV
jgi:hypothetical protein